MLYTKTQVLDYADKLRDSDDEDAFDEFYKEGFITIDEINSELFACYYNKYDKAPPENLDKLCAFIIAGAQEMSPQIYDVLPYPNMPDVHDVIKEQFNDEPLIHTVYNKYIPDDFDWYNVWINAYGNGLSTYYQLIPVDYYGNRLASFMRAIISPEEDQKWLYIDSSDFNTACNENDNSSFSSTNDIDASLIYLYMMLAGEKNPSNRIVRDDVFGNLFNEAFKNVSFERIISNTVSAKKIKSLEHSEKEYLEELETQQPGISNSNTDDWLRAIKISSFLSESGKAAVLVPSGSLVNKKDAALRKLLVNHKKIEAVISLPTDKNNYSNNPISIAGTKIPVSVVILSNNNEAIKVVDLQALFDNAPEKNILPNITFNGKKAIDWEALSGAIRTVLDCNEEDESFVRTLSEEDLLETGYALSFLRYSSKYDLIANGIAFGKVIKSIRRGTSQKGNIINSHESNTPSNYYFLMGSSISELITTIGLPKIEEPEEKLKKYCLKSGNIVITKNGVPKRAGIVEIEENELILSTDNCLIVDLDTTVINPYYVAAYLNSEKGRNSLDRISVGTAIKTISVSDLKEMLIPCPSLQEQKEIAEKYEDYIKELHLLKIREAELQDSLANVFFGED